MGETGGIRNGTTSSTTMELHHPQSSLAMVQMRLPLDIIALVISYAQHDQTVLMTCALVNSSILRVARPLLFHSVTINATWSHGPRSMEDNLLWLQKNPDVARCIRYITLDGEQLDYRGWRWSHGNLRVCVFAGLMAAMSKARKMTLKNLTWLSCDCSQCHMPDVKNPAEIETLHTMRMRVTGGNGGMQKLLRLTQAREVVFAGTIVEDLNMSDRMTEEIEEGYASNDMRLLTVRDVHWISKTQVWLGNTLRGVARTLEHLSFKLQNSNDGTLCKHGYEFLCLPWVF